MLPTLSFSTLAEWLAVAFALGWLAGLGTACYLLHKFPRKEKHPS